MEKIDESNLDKMLIEYTCSDLLILNKAFEKPKTQQEKELNKCIETYQKVSSHLKVEAEKYFNRKLVCFKNNFQYI